MPVSEGIAARSRFDQIRYAQVWEDADVLLAALAPKPGATLVSIASAGDNALSLLTADPAEIIALDLSPVQLACLRLRMAAYRVLSHVELLELMGSRPSSRRADLLTRTTSRLDQTDQAVWTARRNEVVRYGLGGIGKFEGYFRLFRQRCLPLVHDRATVESLLAHRDLPERRRFYEERWNTLRWRLLMRLFFSRAVMGRAGRDPAFFDFAEGSLPAQVAAKTRQALSVNDPAANPYLHWILTGTHGDALPLALRAEHFETIRDRLDRVRLHHGDLESFPCPSGGVDGWNLSDVFEYMPPVLHREVYGRILERTRRGGRLVYWNMMAPRRVPHDLKSRIEEHTVLATELSTIDKAFFYSALRIEERIA